MTTYKLPRYRVRLVRERAVSYRATKPGDAAAILRQLCCERGDREVMAVLYLNARCEIIGGEVVAVGAGSSLATDVRSVVRGAVVAGATSVIMGHNHPSGDSTPSVDDVAMTRAVARGCETLGIGLADHIVVTEHNGHTSMLECGLIGAGT